MQDNENKRLHLQMIEDTITRMGSNSFLIKGWSLTSIGGLITLYVANVSKPWSRNLIWVGIVACVIFWISDAYYLKLEKQYRLLYDIVRKKDNNEIDFSMQPPKGNEPLTYCMLSPIFFSYTVILIIFVFIILLACIP